MNYTLTVENDTVFALCTTSLESVEDCSVQYGRDALYQSFFSTIIGPVNTKFPIFDKLEIAMVYYHQTTVKVNSSLEIIVRSTFVYDSSLTSDRSEVQTTSILRPVTDHHDHSIPESEDVTEVYRYGITLVAYQ